jgi:hypothetical protein
MEDFWMQVSKLKSGAGLVTLAFVAAALFAGTPSTASATTTEDWSLDKQENGIEIYTRPVEGSGIKEFKGVAVVDAGIDGILALLRDSDRFKTWFPNTSESKLLAREGDVSYRYSVMGTPWPMADRDNVLRSVSTRNDKTGVVDITVVAAPDYLPVQDGRVRVQKAHGTWKLEPLGEDKTNVTFTMHLEPGGGIPQWMINVRIVATPFEALTNLRTTVATHLSEL